MDGKLVLGCAIFLTALFAVLNIDFFFNEEFIFNKTHFWKEFGSF